MSPCERPWIWACVSTCVWRWSMATSPSATAPPALLRHHYCAPPPRRPMPYGWTLTCPQLGSISNSKQIWPCQLLEHALKKLTLLSPECCTTSWPTTTCPRTSKIDWGSLPGVEETNRPAWWAFLKRNLEQSWTLFFCRHLSAPPSILGWQILWTNSSRKRIHQSSLQEHSNRC